MQKTTSPICADSITLATLDTHSFGTKDGEGELSSRYAGFLKLTEGKNKITVIAGARFCHYLTPSLRISLIPEECKFPQKTELFLKIQALRAKCSSSGIG